MTQAMRLGAVSVPSSMNKKTYSVNFKGLMAHLVDILVVESKSTHRYDTEGLSSHIQRDIGLMR